MGNEQGASGFSVDAEVFDEMRSLYAGILDNVGSARGLITQDGTNDTGSESLAAILQELLRNVGEFLSETSTNLTLDRDGLATARDNYRSGDARVSKESKGLLDLLPFGLPSLPFGGGPLRVPSSPAGLRVAGPADQIVAPSRSPR